jgi:hypothetical protein
MPDDITIEKALEVLLKTPFRVGRKNPHFKDVVNLSPAKEHSLARLADAILTFAIYPRRDPSAAQWRDTLADLLRIERILKRNPLVRGSLSWAAMPDSPDAIREFEQTLRQAKADVQETLRNPENFPNNELRRAVRLLRDIHPVSDRAAIRFIATVLNVLSDHDVSDVTLRSTLRRTR